MKPKDKSHSILMFYTSDKIKTNKGKCITTKYKYSNKFNVKLSSGEKSSKTDSLNTFFHYLRLTKNNKRANNNLTTLLDLGREWDSKSHARLSPSSNNIYNK